MDSCSKFLPLVIHSWCFPVKKQWQIWQNSKRNIKSVPSYSIIIDYFVLTTSHLFHVVVERVHFKLIGVTIKEITWLCGWEANQAHINIVWVKLLDKGCVGEG